MDEFNDRLDQILEEKLIEYNQQQERKAFMIGIGMIVVFCAITAVVAIQIDRSLVL